MSEVHLIKAGDKVGAAGWLARQAAGHATTPPPDGRAPLLLSTPCMLSLSAAAQPSTLSSSTPPALANPCTHIPHHHPTHTPQVGASEAALLGKLGVKPFKYGLEVLKVYENGSLFDVAVLDITDAGGSGRAGGSGCDSV